MTIAIIDSGVDLDHPDHPDHPDLVDRLVPGRDFFVDGDDEPDDPNGHGTHVAGIAAASSNDIGSDDVIAEAIRWAADNGADVIDLSLGESGVISRFTKGSSLNAAIRDATAAGSPSSLPPATKDRPDSSTVALLAAGSGSA